MTVRIEGKDSIHSASGTYCDAKVWCISRTFCPASSAGLHLIVFHEAADAVKFALQVRRWLGVAPREGETFGAVSDHFDYCCVTSWVRCSLWVLTTWAVHVSWLDASDNHTCLLSTQAVQWLRLQDWPPGIFHDLSQGPCEPESAPSSHRGKSSGENRIRSLI